MNEEIKLPCGTILTAKCRERVTAWSIHLTVDDADTSGTGKVQCDECGNDVTLDDGFTVNITLTSLKPLIQWLTFISNKIEKGNLP